MTEQEAGDALDLAWEAVDEAKKAVHSPGGSTAQSQARLRSAQIDMDEAQTNWDWFDPELHPRRHATP